MPTVNYLADGILKGPDNLIGANDDFAVVLGNDTTLKIVRLPYGGAAQTEALKFDSTAAATFAGPVTILAGGPFAVAGTVNLTGPLNVTSGPVTVVTGGVRITAGGVTATGNSLFAGTFTAGSTATITTGGLVITAGGITSTGNVALTSATLAVGSTVTITTGGLSIVSGPLTVSAGTAAIGSTVFVTTGGLVIVAGGITSTGNVALTSATLAVGSTVTVTTGGLVLSQTSLLSNVPTPATTSGFLLVSASALIPITGLVSRVIASTAAVTSCNITTGLVDGQLLIIINNSTVPIVFSTQATSRVASPATTTLTINQQQAKMLVWSAIDALWYPMVASATAV